MSAALIASLFLAAATPTPPIAAKHPHDVVSAHGTRNDPYYWLRDDTRTDPAVLDYLNAENAYTDAVLAHTGALQQRLYDEIVARIPQDDASVPKRHQIAGAMPVDARNDPAPAELVEKRRLWRSIDVGVPARRVRLGDVAHDVVHTLAARWSDACRRARVTA